MRLVVKDTPLDDETALLSVCGVSAEVGVNVVSQTVEDAAKRRTEGEMRAGVAVRTARPVVKTVSQTRVPVVVCGCVPSADIAAVTNIGENLLNPGQVSVCTALLTLLLYLASGLAAMVVACSMRCPSYAERAGVWSPRTPRALQWLEPTALSHATSLKRL